MKLRLLLGVLLLASAFPAGAEAANYVVEFKSMMFGSPPAHLQVGDTIEWRNSDIFEHTATDKKGSFDVDLPPGGHASTTLKTAGTIDVYCRYHPTMTMRLDVGKP